MWVMLHNKQKPYYCMEHFYVNTEATSIESGLSYSGRSGCKLSEVRGSAKEETAAKAGKAIGVWCTAEVSRGRSTGQIRATQSVEVSHRQEGLNVRMAKQSWSFMAKQLQRKHLSELPL
jgi:hypothetical protein